MLATAAFEGLEGRSLFSATLAPVATLAPTDPAPNTDNASYFQSFGNAVATKGSLALVGTADDRVALYDTSTNTKIGGDIIDPEDATGAAFDAFGTALAFLDNNTFAIAAPQAAGGGKVYVYQYDASSTSLVGSFAAGDYGFDPASQQVQVENFGHAIAAYHGHLLVDVPWDINHGGNGVIVEIDPLTGSLVNTYAAPASSYTATPDQLGHQIVVSGDVFAASTAHVGDAGLEASPVFVFGAGPVKQFDDPSGVASRGFGLAMALEGDRLIVAAPQIQQADDGSQFGGPVYQFSVSGGNLTHTYEQPASVPTFPDFGYTYAGWGLGLAIQNGQVLIGASQALNPDTFEQQGQIYLYDAGTFQELASATAPPSSWTFGQVLAPLANNDWLVSDPGSMTRATLAGDVYVYNYSNPDDQGNSAPTAVLTGPSAAIIDQSVDFSGADSNPASVITAYQWDFDYDGVANDFVATDTTTAPTISHTFTTTGVHHVALRVVGGSATVVSDIVTLDVTVSLPAGPTADAGSPISGVDGTPVSVHGTGTGAGPLSYSWDFNGDNQPDATTADASYTYLTAGDHTAVLTVTDHYGQTATSGVVITTTATAPTADAGADASGLAGTAIAFNGSAAPGIGGTVASIVWNFGDGATFAGSASASHIYTAFGTYTVTLVVTDTDGQSATDTATVTVAAGAPTADAGAGYSGLVGATISLSGVSAAGVGAQVANVAWDFNYDGSTFDVDATTATAATSYAAAGTYTVAFRVTDNDGQTAIATAQVTVTAPPPPPSPVTVSGSTISVAGTSAGDSVALTTNAAGQLVITVGGVAYGPYANGGLVLINLGDGNDVFTGDNSVKANLAVFGGAGNDTIHGGGATDILVGGDGNDSVTAGGGRDLIVGSAGADYLAGKSGEDLIIAGTTVFDSTPAALEAILAEWSSGRTFDQRVANIYDGSGTATRLNGSYFLKADVTVLDDASVDTVSGGGGKDWLMFNSTGSGVLDSLVGNAGPDVITDL